MSMTMIIIISLLFLNLSLTLIMFWILHSTLEATKSLQDSEDILKKVLDLNNQLIEKYNKCLDNVYERETTIHDSVISLTDNTAETYDAITKAYNKMYEQYKLICETHTKLLECWKGCEERYSQSYELFKHCSDNLKEVSFQLTDLANVSTEDEYYLTLQEACDTVCIDCPYGGLKCHDCPVWQLMHRDDIPDGIEGETPPDQEGMIKEGTDDDEWTDDDYRDAVNTHPEDEQNMNEFIDYTKQILDDIKKTAGKTIDDIIIKILEQNGLSIEDVIEHPDDFRLWEFPSTSTPFGITQRAELYYKDSFIGAYLLRMEMDDDRKAYTIRAGYLLKE